jgi:Zn-finger nucleic acid-binding protein
MKCPTCPDSILVLADRQGIEIDYCPACRGVWLDRGELDKLLEKSSNTPAPSAPVLRAARQPDFEDSDYRSRQRHPQYRKKSWLDEIFD